MEKPGSQLAIAKICGKDLKKTKKFKLSNRLFIKPGTQKQGLAYEKCREHG